MDRDERQLARWLRTRGAAPAFSALAELLQSSHGDRAGVFAVDADRRVVFWSSGAEALLGWTREEIVGEHCLKSNRCPQCIKGCGLAEHGEVRGAPLDLVDSRGELLEVHKFGQAFFTADGSFDGAIEVLLAGPLPSPPALETEPQPSCFHGLISEDPAMLRIFQLIESVAETDATVLVRGESGTGKELVARAIHAKGPRRDGPFLAVNCGALAPTLLESELFGHAKGAFTGAVGERKGLFQRAHRGTLFLDEVGEMPPDLQAKLLRVLQDQVVTPVGGSAGVRVDVRVIGATHRSLRRMVEAGSFRQDLMYRLRVVPLFLPPLRERRGDIDLLLRHFIAQANRRGPRRVTRVAPEAMRLLLSHPWPGNVRELINVVQYAFVVGRGPELLVSELPPEFTEGPLRELAPLAPAPVDEAARVRQALEQADGNIGDAAVRLGVSRATFWRWRKKLGV